MSIPKTPDAIVCRKCGHPLWFFFREFVFFCPRCHFKFDQMFTVRVINSYLKVMGNLKGDHEPLLKSLLYVPCTRGLSPTGDGARP